MGTHCHLYINSILKDKKKKHCSYEQWFVRRDIEKKSIKEMTKKKNLS